VRHETAQRWLARGWFAALLFAALFSRALIPVGFMPGAGGIVLCSGYAPVPAVDMPGMDMSGMDMSGAADHGAGGPQRHGMEFCPYTAVAAVMAAGHAPLPTAFTPFIPPNSVFPPEKSIPRGTIVPTSLPRGPPASA
jgi:hypothetical protein